MKQFRNVTQDELGAVYGVVGMLRRIPPAGILTVVDEAAPNYECQPDTWQPVLGAVGPGSPIPGPAVIPAPAPVQPPVDEEAN